MTAVLADVDAPALRRVGLFIWQLSARRVARLVTAAGRPLRLMTWGTTACMAARKTSIEYTAYSATAL
jgi:hypothetical protein